MIHTFIGNTRAPLHELFLICDRFGQIRSLNRYIINKFCITSCCNKLSFVLQNNISKIFHETNKFILIVYYMMKVVETEFPLDGTLSLKSLAHKECNILKTIYTYIMFSIKFLSERSLILNNNFVRPNSHCPNDASLYGFRIRIFYGGIKLLEFRYIIGK